KYLDRVTLTEKTSLYSFQGHLGDQDLYTLIAFDYPELFYTLPCGWNRQLCEWWRNHG
ncbi:Xyloside xylosyltransferase 1, partial [Halocaridina rubra]